MARARLLKPGFFSNEELADLPFEGRLLFAGLWTIADRKGRLEDRPKRIKAALFAYDNVDVDGLLTQLEEARFVLRYEEVGQRFIQILSFEKHQTPHVREPESTIPAPGEHYASPVLDICEPESSPAVAETVTGNRYTETETETETVAEGEAEGGLPSLPRPDLPDPWPEVKTDFENLYGLVGEPVLSQAKEYSRLVPKDWFVQALQETREKAEKPAWRYTQAILDRCLSEQRPPRQERRKKSTRAPGSAGAQILERFEALKGKTA